MAVSNRERVGKALDLLCAGLVPFVERELKAIHGIKWEEIAREGQPAERGKGKKATKLHLGHASPAGSHVEPMEHRIQPHAGSGRAESSSANFVTCGTNGHTRRLSPATMPTAPWTASGVCSPPFPRPRQEKSSRCGWICCVVQFDEQRRQEMRKASFVATEGQTAGRAEAVARGRHARIPTLPPVAISRRSSPPICGKCTRTRGRTNTRTRPNSSGARSSRRDCEGLLKGALLRLAGAGGDPVVELQTNFGGGKSHTEMALYHTFSGTPASEMPGVEELVKETGVEIAPNVKRAVLVGTKISPGQPHKKSDGTVVHTLWGELAWQLGGKEGYKLVKEADETATNPGDALTELFNKYAPCLILIDEWVAYARQLRDDSDLPAGTFDTQFTFAQTISESAKAAKQTMLVVSVPSSDNEIGGQWGQQALARIKNAIGRVESSWRPASPDEGFEIVRRRLFQPLGGDQFVARDAVAHAFSEFYGSQQQEFPSECREANYERRIKMAYPIHPELFDRLYNDWSTLDKFQRTRGVLRLMAAVIHSLWERQDSNLLIMPATVPIDDSSVQFELTRYMEDQWVPVIEKDVDGSNSLPLTLDRENPNLGRYSASRRVARTIYMGSAPLQKAANRGIEDRQIKLGCVQPGETVATFGDALRRLTDRATYLYVDGKAVLVLDAAHRVAACGRPCRATQRRRR